MPGKAVRLDDGAWTRLMQAKGLAEARDGTEYSASEMIMILIDHLYRTSPGMAGALELLGGSPGSEGLMEEKEGKECLKSG